MNVQAEILDLRERLARVEQAQRRTTRGRTNMTGAAKYMGKSREYLRQLHNRGMGPKRADDGTYTFDDLDAFAESRRTP